MYNDDRTPKNPIPQGHGIPTKWPQMLTTGKDVTTDQAFEIIRRTDEFITNPDGGFGNNREFVAMARRAMGMQAYLDLEKEWLKKNPIDYEGKPNHYWWDGWAMRDIIAGCLGHIKTEYVHNTWASSAYIGGPYGWCHPNGKIKYTDNIGKYPSLEEVILEWEDMLEAFPFIEVAVSIFPNEEGYSDEASSNFLVGQGKIVYLESSQGLHVTNELPEMDTVQKFFTNIRDPLREAGLPVEFMVHCGELQSPTVNKLVAVARELLGKSDFQDRDALRNWIYDCQQALERIDMNKAPQHAIIHEKFITEGGINFPYLTAAAEAEQLALPENQDDNIQST